MKKRFLALLLTLVMVLAIVPQAAFAANGSEASTQKAEPTAEIKADGTKAVAEGTTVLAFTSDVHNGTQLNNTGENNLSAIRMENWLSKVMPLYDNKISVMGFCGDMGAMTAYGDTFYSYVETALKKSTDLGITNVLAVGNHEYYNGNFDTTTNSTKNKYVLNKQGRAEADENYRIYCLGSEQQSQTYNSDQITSLTNYLNSITDDKVTIILTHFPLHYYSGRTTSSASSVIDAVNNAVAGVDGTHGTSDDRKIVFLWGHNHTVADNHYDHIYLPGDTISYSSSSSSSKTIKFYYAAAGSMADSEYGQSGQVYGKGLVLTIDSDKLLSFKYYDKEGNVLSTAGSYYTERQVPVTSASIDEATTVGDNGQPAAAAVIPAGRLLQLHYTTVPEDATVKSITWESSNTNIATVDATGKVRGISEGKATITATISDGITRGIVVASIQVTVGPRSAGPMYVLTDTLEPGKNYIIASANTGEAYALTNNNGSIAATTVDIDGDTIYLDEENEGIVFTTSGSGTSVTDIANNGRYLTVSSGSGYGSSATLSLNTSANNRAWTYSDNLLSSTRSSSSTTKYYVYYSTSNGFTCSNSTSGTSSRNVYIFAEVEEQVDATGITISPASTDVPVGKSVQLKATVTPSNANKTVTWSSSSNAVTVDNTGKVTGVTVGGTATITATTHNGLKATCTVTVTENTTPMFKKVDSIKDNGEYLIVNTSTVGSAYALSNPGGSSSGATVGAAAVTVETGDIIYTDAENIVWTATKSAGNSSGYDLTNGTDYLEGKSGNLRSFNSQQYPTRCWTYDGTYLEFVGGDYTYELYYENGFTARSFNSGDATHPVYIYEKVTEQVAVTGVTVSPTTATVEVGKTVQLTATVAPENATNKKVTWNSDKPEIATVDENGKVKGVAVGTAKITATTADGGKTASCNVTVTPRTTTDPTYVIVVDGNALSINRSPNTAQGGSSSYTYTGLAGVAYTSGDADDEICWIFEETDGGYYIRSLDGKYLNATYTSGNNSGNGDLKLDDTKDVWVLDSGYSLEDGSVDGSKLKSTNATNQAGTNSGAKYLSYEDSQNLFTVRSSGNADTVTIEEIETPSSGSYYVKVEADKTEVLPGDVITFTVKLGPITGFGSMEMTIDDIPAGLKYVEGSGDMVSGIGETLGFDFNIDDTGFTEDPLMINGFGTADKTLTAETAIATFQCEVEEDFEGPATITLKDLEFYSVISWIKLDVTAIGATVTLHEHSYTGEPVWNWAEDKSSATATFTCADCVAETPVTETVNATVTDEVGTGENAGYTVYTATVTFNGKTYDSIEKTPIVYAISYNLGSDDAVVEGTNPTSYTVEDGPITLINPTREGYNFLGWTGTGITGASTSVTIAKGSTGDRSYTATWEVSGYEVSGNITSYVGYRDSDPEYEYVEGKVSVKLYVSGSEEAAYEAVVSSDNKTYTIAGVAAGTYEMEVAKKDHVTRTYEITVGTEAVTQDVKIHLLGDINGDGKITNFDAARANSHYKKPTTQALTGYEFDCADVITDGKITNVDAARINSHFKAKTFLW